MTRPYDTALFDLDGTLTDSAPGIVKSVVSGLESVGAAVPDAATLRKFIGPPLLDSFARYCGLDAERSAAALKGFRAAFQAGGIFDNRVYDGIAEMLARHRAAGIRCLVATAKPEPFARKILDHFKLSGHFAGIYGSTLDESRTGKAEVIAYALAREKDLGRTVMVGDRADDVAGARANGLDCIGVLWGYGDPDELEGAVRLVRAPGELPLTDAFRFHANVALSPLSHFFDRTPDRDAGAVTIRRL